MISDQLRLNVAVPPTPTASVNTLGVIAGDLAGFPNGRRPYDDVVDIELRVIAGVLVDGFNKAPNNALSDLVDGPDQPFLSAFPYLGDAPQRVRPQARRTQRSAHLRRRSAGRPVRPDGSRLN